MTELFWCQISSLTKCTDHVIVKAIHVEEVALAQLARLQVLRNHHNAREICQTKAARRRMAQDPKARKAAARKGQVGNKGKK